MHGMMHVNECLVQSNTMLIHMCPRQPSRRLIELKVTLIGVQMMSWVTTLALQILLPMTVVGCAICESFSLHVLAGALLSCPQLHHLRC